MKALVSEEKDALRIFRVSEAAGFEPVISVPWHSLDGRVGVALVMDDHRPDFPLRLPDPY